MFDSIQSALVSVLNDEIYSPFALIGGGICGLVFLKTFKDLTLRTTQGKNISARRVQALVARFENRTRASWALIVVGTLWLAQILLEQSL